jgi:ActR/RegA family two-component response regulator
MLVHGDPWVRTVISDVLLAAGWTALHVSNGWSALRLAPVLRPSFIVIGPRLSEISAGQLIAALQADARTRRMVVITLDAPVSAAVRASTIT